MTSSRRRFLIGSAASVAGVAAVSGSSAQAGLRTSSTESGARAGNPIAVSTYSYWRYRNDAKLKIDECIALAGETGFDAVEILEIQMHRKDNAYLQSLKRQAFVAGLSLCGMSTHQDFVAPKAED